MTENHAKIYAKSKYYDIAFDFRDVPRECDFLSDIFSDITGRKPASFLELAAGPAYHTIEFAKGGLQATAMDISPEMVSYGLERAKINRASIEYVNADMIDFQLPGKYDLAALLMDSAGYLLDNESVYRHLISVSDVLNPGGIYVLEMSHPRDVFGVKESTLSDWKMERGDIKVITRWGDLTDNFDPITQVTDVTVRIKYRDGANEGEIINISKERKFTANEFKALVDASGCFRIVAMYGAMDKDIPFDNDLKAWRMVSVLQKT
ncbi:MAG: methyltransferase domain-containing protein [candidate division Zixibacteria bacterium]|nr:methyltransferase domain-containing protein [candidate division Zixibacteria bacterium]